MTSSANGSKELTLPISSLSNTSPTLEAPLSLCLPIQYNPYKKKMMAALALNRPSLSPTQLAPMFPEGREMPEIIPTLTSF